MEIGVRSLGFGKRMFEFIDKGIRVGKMGKWRGRETSIWIVKMCEFEGKLCLEIEMFDVRGIVILGGNKRKRR